MDYFHNAHAEHVPGLQRTDLQRHDRRGIRTSCTGVNFGLINAAAFDAAMNTAASMTMIRTMLRADRFIGCLLPFPRLRPQVRTDRGSTFPKAGLAQDHFGE